MALRKTRPRRATKARWQTRAKAPQKPRVVVVGVGRLGGALALGLKKAGWPVKVFPRSGESTRKAAKLNLAIADSVDLQQAEICILAVPDSVVPFVASNLMEDLGPSTALIHCAGALTLDALGQAPENQARPRGSFHPLCAISDSSDDLKNHFVALAASDKKLMPLLWRMALALRLQPFEVPESQRALYHASAVLSAGLSVTLLATAVEAMKHSGVDSEVALPSLLALLRSALNGVEKRGLQRGLTGPIARGDLSVVAAHLKALPPEVVDTYRELSRQSVKLVHKTLPLETVTALESLLKP